MDIMVVPSENWLWSTLGFVLGKEAALELKTEEVVGLTVDTIV